MDNPYSMKELINAIQSSKKRSAPGLDQINNQILSILPADYLNILLKIFNNLMNSNVIPDSWRQALVIFIPKPGYSMGPIALMSSILKTFEKMLYRRLRWFIETQFIIPCTQFGFRNFRSCNDNLIIITLTKIHAGFVNGYYMLNRLHIR